MNPQDANSRGLKDGDLVRVFNGRGQVLAGLVVSDDYARGVVRIQEGAWYGPQEGGKVGTLCTYGDPNVLTADIGSSSLAQATTAHTALVEIEKFRGQAPAVTAFGAPESVKGIDPMFPAL
ncbi:Trimethylamine-N-oxide reductase 1 precursor [compost metagenome]